MPDGALRLSDAETLMWRLERHDARLRPIITAVALLDRSPGVDLVARRAAALVDAEPRFGARVVPGVSPLSPPRLVPDDQLDLGHHVRVVGLPGGGGLEDLLGMLGPWVADGLDPSRPLWQLTLVEGMAGGGAALVARVHHCLVDGMGAVALGAVLFSGAGPGGRGGGAGGGRRGGAGGGRGAGAAGALGAAGGRGAAGGAVPGTGWGAWVPGGEALAGAAGELVADVAGEGRRAWRLVRAGAPVLAGLAARAATDPDAAAGALLEQAASVARVLHPAGRPGSALLAGRSGGAVLGAAALPLDAVRAAGRRAGATVNDVFVDAVAEGLRRYHAKHGARPGWLRIGVPIDRGPTSGGGANHFAPARIEVPVQADPADRLRAVHDLVATARSEPALAAWPAMAAGAARLPGAEVLVARAMRGLDAVASNVPGSPAVLHLGPARLLGLVPFGPRSGAACNVTTTSYAGVLHVGITVDPAAAADPATLVDCLTGALTDVCITA